jgi:hypothetical protein
VEVVPVVVTIVARDEVAGLGRKEISITLLRMKGNGKSRTRYESRVKTTRGEGDKKGVLLQPAGSSKYQVSTVCKCAERPSEASGKRGAPLNIRDLRQIGAQQLRDTHW